MEIKMDTKKKIETISNNKKAYFDYEISDKYITGLRLSGTEIKSIRNGNCSIKESFCYIQDNEIFIKNMYIKKYEFGSHNNHEEVYDRKLLLTKQQIKKIDKKINEKGFTLVPLKIMLVNGWAKIEVGIGKGKKNFDKRESIKSKDTKRDIERSIKNG
jgi:SsrA-binding protein